MANRIALTDRSGKWFSPDTADYWKEESDHDGRNYISRATGNQFNHEGLYRTKGGRFILHSWSQFQGTTDNYEEINNEEAAIWFSKNGLDPHEACKEEFEELEIS